MIDYGMFPPEFNSARMYAGSGSGSMLAAAAAWTQVAAQLQSAASAYESIISGLTSAPWLGPSSTAMAAAAAPYVAWMSGTAAQAGLAATQVQTAAAAFEAAFAMTVPPPVVAANRAQLMMLIATNLFGQNAPAIAATEAHYGEMWAQDATAMYGYAAATAAATAKVTAFSPAPQTTNAAGLAAQGAAGSQIAATGVQSTLSQLVSGIPTALQGIASPGSATSGLSGTLSGLLDVASPAAATVGPLGPIDGGSILQTLISEYLYLPGFAALFAGVNAIAPLMNPTGMASLPSLLAAASPAAAAAAGTAGATSALGPSVAGALGGGLSGLGQAASVGGLSVPPNWGWAAAAPPALSSAIPLAMPLPVVSPGAPGGLPLLPGLPFLLGGVPRAATASAGGTCADKYLPRPTVVPRSPAAGYSQDAESLPAHLLPTGLLPTPPPGYRPAIVYVPTDGHAPAVV